MSVNRVLRFLASLIVASILLAIILTLSGVASSKFLPPAQVYSKATGSAIGVITQKEISPSGNPFTVGAHVFILDYKFKAPTPPVRGQTKPGPKQIYYAQVRVDESVYGDPDSPVKVGVDAGTLVHVKYEPTDPDISGIDKPDWGRGCGPGSNILSGWLLFVLLDLVLAYVLMQLLERFAPQEDI